MFLKSLFLVFLFFVNVLANIETGFFFESSFSEAPFGVGILFSSDEFSVVADCSVLPVFGYMNDYNSELIEMHKNYEGEEKNTNIDISLCIGRKIKNTCLFTGPAIKLTKQYNKYKNGVFSRNVWIDKNYKHTIGGIAGFYQSINSFIFGASAGYCDKPIFKVFIGGVFKFNK